MILKGFLGKEELEPAQKFLNTLSDKKKQTLFIEIDSSSGDLNPMLELAKHLYELKILQQLKVIIYIDGNAVGPAAILPFLADELYGSLFISWGDIPLGSEGALPTNLLRNRVRSLINTQHPHASLLATLADAMTDPSAQKDLASPLISATGQTLVVNQNQLKELKLIDAILPLEDFEARLGLKSSKLEQEKAKEVSLPSSSLEDKLRKFIPFNPEGPHAIGYLYIGDHEDSISDSTWLYIRQGLEYYKQHPPLFIILELNTPGGEVFAAQKISDALKEIDTQNNIPIVTFINNWAISAGAMLAYSSRFISVVKDGSMGAAEPVYAGKEGKLETASEKVNSAIRADFASRARFFDRSPLIAEAMVDKDMILVWRHGRVVKLDNENQIRLSGPEPDQVISPKGKLLTLNAEQMMTYGVADIVLEPKKLSAITSEEQAAGKWPAHKMLLFHTPYFAQIPQAAIQAYQMDWKTRFFVFLATPLVSSLLFMGLLVGAYMEFSTPGFGLPGSIAAICLFLIILSSFSLKIANWLELILLLTGLVLVLVELFVLPTFGLLGIVGVILFIVGLLGMLIPGLRSISFDYDPATVNTAGQYVMKRLAWLGGALLASCVIIALLARYVLPKFSGFHRLVLAGHEQEGFIAGESPHNLPAVGSRGEALSDLRPTGKIIVQDQIYEALSTEGFIEAGTPLVISRLEGSTLFVSRLTETEIL